MKLVNKHIILVLCAVIFIFQLSACSKDKDSDASSTKDPVEITWWNFPNYQTLDGEEGKYEKEIIAAFNDKNPNIKVNLKMISFDTGPQDINVAIASNQAPDVIYDSPGRIIDWGKKKLLAPLNDMVTDEIKNDIAAAFWKQSMVGDQIYMYPVNTAPFMMGVNKTIFEQMGMLDLLPLDRPDRTWTVAEYEKAVQAVKENAPGIVPTSFFAVSTAGDQGTRAYLANMGISRFLDEGNSKVAINTEDAGKALDWIVQATKDNLSIADAASLSANDVNNLFLEGKLAFTLNYSPILKAQNKPKKKVPFEDVLLPFPTKDGSKPKLEPYLGGLAIFNNGNSQKMEASKKFIDFVANDPVYGKKNLIQTGGLSVRSSISGLYDDSEYKYADVARQFITDPPTTADGYGEIRNLWYPELQKALLGNATGKEALDSFAEKANLVIAKIMARKEK
ncbi:ABC transporter substrate-binding protein [Paenibacillus sp. SAF-054]|uniref:ABC transporter substrate-binding protein n=1 Tax=unclassified Paenibacillus TaxID=185978 RepID=UPI003F802557